MSFENAPVKEFGESEDALSFDGLNDGSINFAHTQVIDIQIDKYDQVQIDEGDDVEQEEMKQIMRIKQQGNSIGEVCLFPLSENDFLI